MKDTRTKQGVFSYREGTIRYPHDKAIRMKNIAIIGSGVVGGATGRGFLLKGHSVVFHDVDDDVLHSLRQQGFEATHIDNLDASQSDVFFFAVSTPTEKGRINLMHLKSAVRSLGKKLRNREGYCMIVIRSTVPPKTTEDLLIPILEKESRKKAGEGFGVAVNPEYLREKSADNDFNNPWAVTVGSLDRRSRLFMEDMFSDYGRDINHLSIREAEMQKYVHNLYNALKIAFFNEMRVVCERVDIAPESIFNVTAESAEGFWNKGYGMKDKGPFAGTCLPKDTQAFLSWSKKLKVRMDVLNGVIDANERYKEIWDKAHGMAAE